MQDIKQYLDSTYLKKPKQAGLTKAENTQVATKFIQEAIDENFKLIMIRPEIVSIARELIDKAQSKVLVGTVIDFPKGKSEVTEKLKVAQLAIDNGADELDYVINYRAFKKGEIQLVKDEVIQCTALGLQDNCVVKWIIEVAALKENQIAQISALIKNTIMANFSEKDYQNVFVKSSTGFFKTKDNLPNGATIPSITIMPENASPLPIKAAGGVRSLDEAIQMIKLGVKRIGTSSAKAIVSDTKSSSDY